MLKKPFYLLIPILIFSCITLDAQVPDSTAFITPQRTSLRFTYLPSALFVSGIILNGNGQESLKREIVEERNEIIPAFKTRVDDYLALSPIGIAYGLDAVGFKSKNNFANKSIILIKGELLMTGVVFGLKKATHQLRPDNSSFDSFPSGHTAQAFAAAAFLTEEYKDQFKWMPYLAYGIASSVGLLRMANNKHYISDVLAGAGLGILSMKLSYATHKYKWGNKHHRLT